MESKFNIREYTNYLISHISSCISYSILFTKMAPPCSSPCKSKVVGDRFKTHITCVQLTS